MAYIERKAANDWLMDMFYSPDDEGCKELVERFNKAIPAVDVVPVRHGRWIVDDISGIIKCSECGNDAPVDTTGGGQWCSPFCHSCGAKMDGSKGVR